MGADDGLGPAYRDSTERGICAMSNRRTNALVDSSPTTRAPKSKPSSGLGDELAAEFAPEKDRLTDALIYCDMTTSPDGGLLHVNERLSEILSRYGSAHLVARSITAAAPCIRSAVGNVQEALRSS